MRDHDTKIRLALPSKGRLAEGALSLLEAADLPVRKSNPRRFQAAIPSLPQFTVLFQRAADIPVSVRDNAVDLGITGWDLAQERVGDDPRILPLLPRLGFGHCRLNLIVPESWRDVKRMDDLAHAPSGSPLRVATKFPNLTGSFLSRHNLNEARLVPADGTLEVAPALGYADIIADLVSAGTTLRENHLKLLEDGCILESQASLIASRRALKTRPEVLSATQSFVEFLVAHLRAAENLSLFANVRADSEEELAARLAGRPAIAGLQGPTVAPVITQAGDKLFSMHIIVPKVGLTRAIGELREIRASGIVVAPVSYIFEEQPQACRDLAEALKE